MSTLMYYFNVWIAGAFFPILLRLTRDEMGVVNNDNKQCREEKEKEELVV